MINWSAGRSWSTTTAFWTLAPTHMNLYGKSEEGAASQFIKTRIGEVIFTDAIPSPRDVIITCLVNTCGVFRYIFELDDKAEERIDNNCKMDLIGRSIADAVEQSIAKPLFRRAALSRRIPRVPLGRLIRSPHLRGGNTAALFRI